MDEFQIEKRYWLALSVCEGIGPVRFHKLLHNFGSAEKAWNASVKELKKVIGEKTAEHFADFREEFSLEDYEARLQKLQVSYIILPEKKYPQLLKKSKKPPIILYKKGTYTFNENDTLVSVVGTRKITEYGKQVTEFLVSDLVAAGCVIVSGLALGVDAKAAESAIAAGGKTIAVLGSGVDLCTPAENSNLYDKIIESGGAIVSEYPLGTKPNVGSFPARNRIIAGLSVGVLVTEGAQDSGSLITANDAFEFGRKVFAVPGPITSSVSKGPISLIAKGAKMVMSAQDILEELDIKSIKSIRGIKSIKGLTKEEQKIIELLQDQNLHFDEIIKKTGFSSSQLSILISLMEMKGLVKNIDGGYYVLKVS